MNSMDPRIDAYIEKSADFAKPILNHIRELVHFACPEVEETMKWGFPHFIYKGILCSMASFKQHCAVGFWKVFQAIPGVKKREETAMGHLGRITTIADLPDRKTLTRCIIEAVHLNETGTKLPSKPKPPKKELVVPDDLAAALKKTKWPWPLSQDLPTAIERNTSSGSPERRRKPLERKG